MPPSPAAEIPKEVIAIFERVLQEHPVAQAALAGYYVGRGLKGNCRVELMGRIIEPNGSGQ
jgi:hypothetical protein